MTTLFSGLNQSAFKKITFSLIFIFSCLLTTAQEKKGIMLKKENSKTSVFFSENRRIKITTTSDKKIVGNFVIVDNNSISINDQLIPLDSISSIVGHSKVSSVLSPLSIGLGALFTVFGVAGVSEGGYGVLAAPFIPVGLTMALLPVLANKHRSDRWNYQIVN